MTAFPKPQPSVVTKHAKRKAADLSLAQAYAEVDARDGGKCWVTGRHTRPGVVDPNVRREHHHLKGRNVKPEWRHKPERIITVCNSAHVLITAGWIVVEGCDARKPIRFSWAEHVKAKDKPLVIQRQTGER